MGRTSTLSDHIFEILLICDPHSASVGLSGVEQVCICSYDSAKFGSAIHTDTTTYEKSTYTDFLPR